MLREQLLAALLFSGHIGSALSDYLSPQSFDHGLSLHKVNRLNRNLLASEEEDDEETSSDNDGGCETAFGYNEDNSLCFLDDGNEDFSRWGWTLGPFSVDSESGFEVSSDMYAGAGQCDLSKGENVGSFSLSVGSDGSFDASLDAASGFEFTEFHLYIGTNKYPTDNKGDATVAPGQFTYQTSDTSISGDIDNFDDENEYYVIAHAVSCASDETTEEEEEEPTTSEAEAETESEPSTSEAEEEEDEPSTSEAVQEEEEPSTSEAETEAEPEPSTSEAVEECTDNYIVLSNGWTSGGGAHNLDGTYLYQTHSSLSQTGIAWVREDGSYAIAIQNSPSDSTVFYLDIVDSNGDSVLEYLYGTDEWSNFVNPLIEDANAWADTTEVGLSIGDATMYDCDGNDVGEDLCPDVNSEDGLFPGVYVCEEGNPMYYGAGERSGYKVAVFVGFVSFLSALLRM